MKRNIDLTENRDFSLENNNLSIFSMLKTKSKVPWSTVYKEMKIISCEEELYHNSPFPVGSIQQIKQYKEFCQYEGGTRCDRCGCKLKSSFFGERLCTPCSEQLYKDVKGFENWNKQFEMTPRDFLAQYLNMRSAKL